MDRSSPHFYARIAISFMVSWVMVCSAADGPSDGCDLVDGGPKRHRDVGPDSSRLLGYEFAKYLFEFRHDNSTSHYYQSVGVNGQSIQLHYRAYRRSGSRRAIVIAPGFATPETKYIYFVEKIWRIDPNTDIFVLDLRSQGRSESTIPGNGAKLTDSLSLLHVDSFNDYTLDFLKFFNSEFPKDHYNEVVLYGASLGGSAATWAVINAPELQQIISRVVLVAPGYTLPRSRLKVGPVSFNPNFLGGLLQTLIAARVVSDHGGLPFQPSRYVYHPDMLDIGAGQGPLGTNPVFDWTYYYLLGFEIERGEPFPGLIERTVPTPRTILEMLRAYKVMRSKIWNSVSTPFTVFTSEREAIVDNAAAQEICKNLPSCSLNEVKGQKHEMWTSCKDEVSVVYDTLKGTNRTE